MKRLLSISIIVLFSFTLFGCRDIEPGLDTPREVRLDFQSFFNEDFVTASLDGLQVYSDTVTTNPRVGLASNTTLTLTNVRHEISVIVNNKVSGSMLIPGDKTEVVMVRYDSHSEEVMLEISDRPILYY